MVQLREKEADSREFVEFARALKNLLAPSGVPFIINDRADIAMIVGADGLHIGQRDISFPDARRLLGPGAIIGVSVENVAQAKETLAWNPDYVAASPVFGTPTKEDTAPALGLEGLKNIRDAIPYLLVAIGGINNDNIRQIHKAGADMAAVVGAISSADDPEMAARELIATMNG